mgnify:CR=1 FL=1
MQPDLASSRVVLGPGGGNVPDGESDAPLVRQYQEGDREALVQIVERHERAVRRLLLMLCPDRHEVDDLCQEVFLRLVQRLPKMSPPDSLRPWLYRTGINLVRDRARRWRVRHWFALTKGVHRARTAGVGAPSDVPAEQQELVERLRAEIHELPAAWREVVVLRDLQGLPPGSVAELLGIPVKVVNDRLYRARRALALRLRRGMEQGES